ncbi:retrotransposon protein, putative, ty3-gypsy subclass [Tanacetum coccineum]|uniref:Retrotransposon protein, putative, ty3-gypsy subclass n=1 Tax=Tanacetum coccineum TaxID=301880 RepID=A0ABQ4YHW1_9ASTR
MTTNTTLLSKRCHPSNLRSPRDVQLRPRRMSLRRSRRRQKNRQKRKRLRCAKVGAMFQKIVFQEHVVRVLPRIGAFCAIIKNIEADYESGTNDIDVYQKACAKYKMMYKGDFMLEHCYNILKDHLGWKNVEMPNFYQSQGRQKSKTSETTSGSASSGLNLNEEADEVVEETQEFRPMGRDRAKTKKKATGSSRGGASSFVDLVADKFYNMKQKNRERRTRNNSPI